MNKLLIAFVDKVREERLKNRIQIVLLYNDLNRIPTNTP